MTPDNNSNAVWVAALVRGIAGAVAAAITVGVGALAAGSTNQMALLLALSAFASYMATRFAVEGGIDSGRAKSGNVLPSDVGQHTTTITTSTPISAAPVTITQPDVPPAA